MEWYKKGSAYGHPGCMYKVGYFYEVGLGGLSKDLGKATEYYRRAADKGDRAAKEALDRLSGGSAPAPAPKPQEEKKEEPPKKKGFFSKLFGGK